MKFLREIELNEKVNHGRIPSLINDLNIHLKEYNAILEEYEYKLHSTLDVDPLIHSEYVHKLNPIIDDIISRVERLKFVIKTNDYNIIDDLNDIINRIDENRGRS